MHAISEKSTLHDCVPPRKVKIDERFPGNVNFSDGACNKINFADAKVTVYLIL